MPIIQLITDCDKVFFMNAGGGDAGEVEAETIIRTFGTGKRLFLMDDLTYIDIINRHSKEFFEGIGKLIFWSITFGIVLLGLALWM